MVYPPGQGKSGSYLMKLWRSYLEQYAENEGKPEDQIIVGACHAAELLGCLTQSLDREGNFASLIEQRIESFREHSLRAVEFQDRLVNASFGLYNHLNTLARQFAVGNDTASQLIAQIEEQVHLQTKSTGQIERSAWSMRSAFPLAALATIILDEDKLLTDAIRQVEQRFAGGAARASTDWEHLTNALYRVVEMMQLLVTVSDAELKDQVNQIASRFQEEDQTRDLLLKVRNGYCRLFELGHLLTTHLDEIL